MVSLLQTAPGKGLELCVAQVSLKLVRICPLSCGSGCPFSGEFQSLAGVFLDHSRQYGRRTVSQPLNLPLGRALVLSGRHIREFLGLGLETNGGTDGGCFLFFLFYVFVLFFAEYRTSLCRMRVELLKRCQGEEEEERRDECQHRGPTGMSDE